MNGKIKRAFVVPSAIMLFGALALSFSCGGDEEEPGETGGTTGGTGGAGGGTFTGRVVNSVNVTEAISGIKVRFFNVDTGAFLPGEWTSGSDGRFTAERPENAGVFVVGNGMWSDTWNHPPARKGEEELVRMSSAASASTVPAIAMYSNDPDAAPLAGSVLWHNSATNVDEFVGCATVDATDGVADIRYFADNGLPTSLATRSLAQGTAPANGQGTNDAQAGKFFIANLGAGMRTISASINGTKVASRTLFVTARKDGNEVTTTPPQKSNVQLASLYVEGAASNPTPAGCK